MAKKSFLTAPKSTLDTMLERADWLEERIAVKSKQTQLLLDMLAPIDVLNANYECIRSYKAELAEINGKLRKFAEFLKKLCREG